ncbi:MAG TPA: hypothetical protein PK812_05400, partial [Beijerinckiaceae bacterium]|nr:hypothetical protein [Beijerinckiaceae bacterium]
MATGRTQDPAQPAVAHSAPAAKGIGKTSRRKWALWVASGIAGTLTAILLGIALILFLGIEGNAMVARMVRERIVLALQERIDPSLRLAIGAVDLKRKESGTAVRVSDFTVKGPDGRVLVSAPSGMVVVDTTSLFVFRLIPTEVVLDDLHVFVEISEAGTLSISPGDGA